jgi:hypothetical protein
MLKFKHFIIILVFIGLYGCAGTKPPPTPLDSQSSIIGICLKTRTSIKIISKQPNLLYFISLNDTDTSYLKDAFIPSNYCKDDQIYLLNAKPGRYAVVAAFKSEQMYYPSSSPSEGFSVTYTPPSEIKSTTLLSEEMIKMTDVTVAPGSVVFLGAFVVDQSMTFGDPDKVQAHYVQLISPDSKTGYFSQAFSGKHYYKGSFHKKKCDENTEYMFLKNALVHFKDTEWESVINKRIRALKAEVIKKREQKKQSL